MSDIRVIHGYIESLNPGFAMSKEGGDAPAKPAAVEQHTKLESGDVQQARNASGQTMGATEGMRTNASDGSLRDRAKLAAEQEESIQIMGAGGRISSRISKLSESDLTGKNPQAKSIDVRELLAKPEKEAQALVEQFGQVADMPAGAARDAAQKQVQDLADRTYSRGQFASNPKVDSPGADNGQIQIGSRFYDRNQLLASSDVQSDVVSDATNATFETDKSRIAAKVVESSSTLIKSGLDYNAGDVPLSQKLGSFAKSAQARLLDPEGRKAYVQGVIDEVTGVGEGLNIAKEELKTSVSASAQKAWTALCDGSVANFMATPNAINEPLFKTIGSCLDTMSRDPNAVNNVLTVMGRELQTASDKYSRMSPHERGVQDGKAMFFFMNPEGSTEAGELALKAADRVATHVDKTVVDGITKAMQAADQLAQSAPEMAAQSRQMVRDYIQNLGLSPRELAYDGMPSRYIEDLRPDNDNVFMMKEKSHDFVKNVDGLDKVSEIRQKYGIDNDQNIAYAEVKIGDHEEHLIGISGRPSPEGTVSMPENPKLTAKPRGFMKRDDHSEKKILENVIEKINESTDGSIKIYSEREPCDSCEKVIYQFREAFKKIPVTVEYGLSRRN